MTDLEREIEVLEKVQPHRQEFEQALKNIFENWADVDSDSKIKITLGTLQAAAFVSYQLGVKGYTPKI